MYPSAAQDKLLNVDTFSGINWDLADNRIKDNECTYMDNFEIKENGVLSKRKGLKALYKYGMSVDRAIIGMCGYKNDLYVLVWGEGLYKAVFTDGNITDLTLISYKPASVDNQTTSMFIFNDILFILTGGMFWQYDGTTLTAVEDKAYVPTLYITCNNGGIGERYEDWNLLSYSFKQSFSTVKSKCSYEMCMTDIEINKVLLDGSEIPRVGGTGNPIEYSVSVQKSLTQPGLTKTVVTILPDVENGYDNLEITATITNHNKLWGQVARNREKINKCTVYSFYGGQNDTRILLGGKDSMFYRSGTMNPFYFPENSFQNIGSTSEKITGFAIQYDYCVIFKENSIWQTRFELYEDGSNAYVTKPLNDEFGCEIPKSIQLIDNSPIFFDKKNGFCIVKQSNVRDERNTKCISQRINKTIENERGLLNNTNPGFSLDHDFKYFYFVDSKVYIYDYHYDLFYIWNLPFNVKCAYEYNKVLYITDDIGGIYKFTDQYKDEKFNTSKGIITSPIHCKWKSKLFDFGTIEKYKTIKELFINQRANVKTSANVNMSDGNKDNTNFTTYNYLIDYSLMDYSRMSYECSDIRPITECKKVKFKKVMYFQFIIENSELDETLDIYGFAIKYKVMGYVRC